MQQSENNNQQSINVLDLISSLFDTHESLAQDLLQYQESWQRFERSENDRIKTGIAKKDSKEAWMDIDGMLERDEAKCQKLKQKYDEDLQRFEKVRCESMQNEKNFKESRTKYEKTKKDFAAQCQELIMLNGDNQSIVQILKNIMRGYDAIGSVTNKTNISKQTRDLIKKAIGELNKNGQQVQLGQEKSQYKQL